MSKILDLSTFVQKTLDIKLPDGTLLSVKKPTQSIAIQMMALQHAQETEQTEKQVQMACSVISQILSNNKEDKKITDKYVFDKIDFELLSVILEAYFEFMQEIQSNPN